MADVVMSDFLAAGGHGVVNFELATLQNSLSLC